MIERNVYWFRIPKYLENICIAVMPFYDTRDKRLKFEVTGDGTWNLDGTLVEYTEESIIFRCNDKVMGAHGGTYHLHYLTYEDFCRKIKRHVASGGIIADACHSTDDLHFWFRKNWRNREFDGYSYYIMMDNSHKGNRTDIGSRDLWALQAEREAQKLK